MNRDPRRLRLVLVLLLLASVTLIALDGKGGRFGGLRNAASTVIGPIQRAVVSVVRPIGDFGGDLVHARTRGNDLRAAQREVDTLQGELQGNGDAVRDKAELSKLVALAYDGQFTFTPARVIAIGDLSGFDKAATLDVGTPDAGVRVDAVVIGPEGLVGRVVSVSHYSCNIVLADDSDFAVDARVQSTAQRGTLSGHGSGSMTFVQGDPAAAPPKVGDVIETSGAAGSLFPVGIQIGRVSSVGPTAGRIGVTAQVTPFADFGALDVVGVIAPRARSTPATALTPTPKPTPTVTVRVTVTRTVAPSVTPGVTVSGTVRRRSTSPSTGASNSPGGG